MSDQNESSVFSESLNGLEVISTEKGQIGFYFEKEFRPFVYGHPGVSAIGWERNRNTDSVDLKVYIPEDAGLLIKKLISDTSLGIEWIDVKRYGFIVTLSPTFSEAEVVKAIIRIINDVYLIDSRPSGSDVDSSGSNAWGGMP